MSILLASGGIVSSVVTGGIALVAVSTGALLIQGWMKHKDLSLKIHLCTYAYQSYQHLLIQIKDMIRRGDYNPNTLFVTMNNIDNYVCDNSPIVDKYYLKYDQLFID